MSNLALVLSNRFPAFVALASLISMALPVLAQQPPPTNPPPVNPPTPVPAPLTSPEPITVPPPPTAVPYVPFPHLPPITLDETNNGVGIAQQVARARGLQARMLWIDATANLDTYNSADKIKAIVAQAKAAGFNTLCFEAKPIMGYLTYPSTYAPQLTLWQKPGDTKNPPKTLPAGFDPLRVFSDETRAQGMTLIVNFNAFSEGHNLVLKGPGYEHPEWQSVIYEERASLKTVTGEARTIFTRVNELSDSEEDLSVYTDTARLLADTPKRHPETAYIVIVNRVGKVIASLAGLSLPSLSPTIPDGGAAYLGSGTAGELLRTKALVGDTLTLDATPTFIPTGLRPRRQIALMTNPFRDDVRQRLLGIISEVVTKYPVDGIIFDDRLRYTGLDGDFSDEARRGFEQYIGKQVAWPDDVYRYHYDFPTMDRTLVPGPQYDAFLVYRALNLRNFVASVVRTVKGIRSTVTVSTYVGSWYPDYPDVGANWAADDFSAGLRFLNDSYRKTGWAGLCDFIVTGCYYPTATIADAVAQGQDIGATVEAAGQFSNRAVNDASWVYAGIQLADYKGRPDDLKKALQAACATTQGIMIFDLSHDITPMWPVFAETFKNPALLPHLSAEATAEVKQKRAEHKASGVPDPPVIIYKGKAGTGF